MATKTRELADFLTEGGVQDIAVQQNPHIQPGVLYPAVAGKGIDGSTTVTSFGTDFAISGYPTLKYYYTDIKGSKPIKDPRIGSHFGSQRHDFRSVQLLEQETATHGADVFSVDGREWCRMLSLRNTKVYNTADGLRLNIGNTTAEYVEVVGSREEASTRSQCLDSGNVVFS